MTGRRYAIERHRDDETGYRTSVYRLFDKRDRLLYIGVAQDVNARIYMHLATWTMADANVIHMGYARHEAVEYRSRAAARKVERKAIETERPWLNRQHNPTRWRRVDGQYRPLDQTAHDEFVESVRADYEARWSSGPDPELDSILEQMFGIKTP